MQISKPGNKALRLGRCSQPQGIYFITISRHLSSPGNTVDAQLLCWVVMPDHIHLLLQLASCPLSRVMDRLKSSSAIILNREIGRNGRFWTLGFYDHALRKEEDIKSTARYIIANPLRAGLVQRVGQYPHWNAIWL